MRFGVVGLGLIGGSLLQRVASVPELEARGFDADPATCAAAAEAGFAIDAELAGWAEVVAVAVPPRATAATVADALTAGGAAVFDVASVKAPVVDAVRAAVPADALARYVPAHPLAGSERGGWAAARPDLLDAAVWAICPHDLAGPLEPLAAVARVLDALDARLCFCTPEDHDAAVARSSHVPHVVAQALAATIDSPLAAVLSGGALRDGTRVASADPDMWSDVLALNAPAIAPALGSLLARLETLRAQLQAHDVERLRRGWADGGAERRQIDALRWTDRAWHRAELPADWRGLMAQTATGGLVRRVRLAGAFVELERSQP